MNSVKRPVWVILFAYFVLLLSSESVFACSRVLSADNGQAVLTGRNFDWAVDLSNELRVFPRGEKRDGIVENPLEWVSKYGNIVVISYFAPGIGGVSDGMNEKGLSVNELWLDKCDYGARDKSLKGLSVAMWAQYYLDNFSTIEEAIQSSNTNPYQVVGMSVPAGDVMLTAYVHLSLEDRTGDSAIIEYIDGKPVVHHGRQYAVMTNEPPLDQQLQNLKQYDGFGGIKPLPGTTQPEDRFVRASYYLKYLPKPDTLRQAIAHVFSVTRNISQPFRASVDPQHPNTSATIWSVCADSTNGTYYFESPTSPYLIWANLKEFNLKEGSPEMKLDLSGNPDYYGDVTKLFVQAAPLNYSSLKKFLK